MDPYIGDIRVRRDPPGQNDSEDTLAQKWHSIFQREPYSMARRPSFGLWLRITWPDILTMLLIGAVGIGLFYVRPIGTRMFPLTVIDTYTGHDTGEVVYPQLAYPYRPQIISSWVDTALVTLVPLFFFLVAQVRIGSFWDFNNAIIGFIYALETSSTFQVVIKWAIGGLRPNFYDVCKPAPYPARNPAFNPPGQSGVGYMQYMYTSEICITKGRPLWDAMQSFPSGHSTTTFAAAIYLYLYLNAKLKVFANYHPSMWKLVLLYLPILGAILLCGSLILDNSHNWYDILAGAAIGTMFAFSAYRMVYAGVWDWRVNHIPLNRAAAFIWSEGCEGLDMVFTNRVGWRAARMESEKETLPGPATGNGNMYIHSQARLDGNTEDDHAEPRSSNGQPKSSTRRSRE
ncbi:acid phosphatase/Vanadium-dependent haloperoxidase [Hypoxylon cercidicola]|nr:acid phosphatase/Vanadium-dependent haloperoxidase [Hypoxylon cercidicola]